MSPADAPVRIPVDLLSRATKLNPENRAEMIRVACELGLASLEAAAESSQAHLSEVVSALIDEKISSLKPPSSAPERLLRIPMIPKGASLPVHSEWEGNLAVVQFEAPQVNWMVYQIVDLEIYADNHAIRVSDLRMNGEGENLLTPGWHSKDDFGHGSGVSSVLHQGVMISPNTLTLDVWSTKSQSSPVSISIIARVLRDDAFGPGPLEEAPASRGALVQVPFRREKNLFVARSPANSVLKIHGIQFKESVEGLCRIPQLRDLFLSSLSICGSPNLLPWEEFISSLDFSRDFFGLRAAPILIPPNFAQVDLRTASGREIDEEDLPSLVCEVIDHGNRRTIEKMKTHFERFPR